MYSCEFCGNDARYGHYCTPQVPFIYPEPCYNQDFNFPQDFHDFQQQYLCCENCGGPHETFQCQPMNEDYYEQNSFYDPNSFGFDQFQPLQYTVNHPIFNVQNDLLNSQNKLMEQMTSICDMVGQIMQKKEEEKRIAEEQAAKDRYWKIPICYDDDEDNTIAITPDLPTKEPEYSLIMWDESLDTIPEKELDELIKSSVENLVPIPSESEDFFDNGSDCDVPECDETSLTFTTFSNPLFDSNNDFTSSDDESLSDEDVPMENFKIYSNPLFDDEEIISTKIDPHSFNAESNFIESLLNRDILIDSSPKFDYLLEEFSGELAHINPIPPGIKKADFDLEEEIRLVENLLYDNSSPRPPEELNLEIADTIFESFSPSPILVEDSDSLIEEVDLFLATNDSMPPGIEDDDYDSEGDIRFLEELFNNDSLPLPEYESFFLDHFDDPSLSRPPPEPPDVEICFDFEPDTGVMTTKVVKGISEHYVLMPNILPTFPTLDPDLDFTPSHDSVGSILTWEVLKSRFLSKYCPPTRTAKKMDEINNFQQEPDESLILFLCTRTRKRRLTLRGPRE
ncbi:hypothetical protein Tco_0892934 [Tanacetum coccineum]|uniref:Retrotransposon gag domain-containing protein n=1 Tax=Tanacetum coccineum TaxID=301880 RepID=A0ABQ5CA34_9ASTR